MYSKLPVCYLFDHYFISGENYLIDVFSKCSKTVLKLVEMLMFCTFLHYFMNLFIHIFFYLFIENFQSNSICYTIFFFEKKYIIK